MKTLIVTIVNFASIVVQLLKPLISIALILIVMAVVGNENIGDASVIIPIMGAGVLYLMWRNSR